MYLCIVVVVLENSQCAAQLKQLSTNSGNKLTYHLLNIYAVKLPAVQSTKQRYWSEEKKESVCNDTKGKFFLLFWKKKKKKRTQYIWKWYKLLSFIVTSAMEESRTETDTLIHSYSCFVLIDRADAQPVNHHCSVWTGR